MLHSFNQKSSGHQCQWLVPSHNSSPALNGKYILPFQSLWDIAEEEQKVWVIGKRWWVLWNAVLWTWHEYHTHELRTICTNLQRSWPISIQHAQKPPPVSRLLKQSMVIEAEKVIFINGIVLYLWLLLARAKKAQPLALKVALIELGAQTSRIGSWPVNKESNGRKWMRRENRGVW